MDNLQMNVVCAICLEVWDQPKTLPCEHIFCEKCVLQLVQNVNPLLKTVTCPECREEHAIPNAGITRSWGTLRRLQSMADEIRELNRSSLSLTPTSARDMMFTEADPGQSYLALQNDVGSGRRNKVGDEIKMVIQLCNRKGQIIAGVAKQHDIKIFVALKPRSHDSKRMEIKYTLTAEGKYLVHFNATVCGLHEVTAYLSGTKIKKSPLDIPVMPRDILGCEIKGPLKGPRDVVAWGEDNFLVADGIAKAVFLVDHCGRAVTTLKMKTKLAESFSPMAIAVFEKQIFVTDMSNKCVHVYKNMGDFPVQFGKEHLIKPTGIIVSHSGDIFVADGKSVVIFDQRYQFIKSIQFCSDESLDAISNPQKMAINKAGDKLVLADQGDQNNNYVKILNVFENKVKHKIVIKVGSEPVKPCGVAVDQGDNIFVSVKIPPKVGDPKKGKVNAKGLIIAYTCTGSFLGYFGNELENPEGLHVINSGNPSKPSMIYVADSPGHRRNGSLKGFII